MASKGNSNLQHASVTSTWYVESNSAKSNEINLMYAFVHNTQIVRIDRIKTESALGTIHSTIRVPCPTTIKHDAILLKSGVVWNGRMSASDTQLLAFNPIHILRVVNIIGLLAHICRIDKAVLYSSL